MSTVDERAHLEYALKEINESQVWDIPTRGYLNSYQCPLCDTPLLEDLSFDEIEKIKTWTVAQLVAWHNLQQRSGLETSEFLAQTADQPRPGIGALYNATVLGVNLNGIFIGIEADGYVHS